MKSRTLPPTPPHQSFLVRPVSLLRWRYVNRFAPWLLALLLFATFIDLGGAFFIKLALTVVALAWVLTRRKTLDLWLMIRWDLLIFLGVPIVLGLLHITAGHGSTLGDIYQTLSSQMLLLLYPLFVLAGGARAQRVFLNLYVLLALVMLVAGVLHVVGAINLADYTAFAQGYRIGFIGIDARQANVAANLRPVVGPRVAYTLVLGLGLALPVSALYSAIIGAALVLLKARGMLLGAMALVAVWGLTTMHPSLRIRRRTLYMLLLVPLLIIVMLSIPAVRDLLLTSWNELGVRLQQAWYAEDESTLIRIGHLQGYRYMVEQQPLGLWLGFGPGATLYNPHLDELLNLTEISVLNIALWYGIPYAALFFSTLLLAAFKLALLRGRPGFTRDDWGLALGALFFWIAGNTNPLLSSPIAFFALMLIRVRIREIRAVARVGRQAAGASDGAR